MAIKIRGIDGMSIAEIDQALTDGGRFVFYEFTISIIILTFKRSSDIFYVPPGGSLVAKGLPYILVSLLLGWWGIPWGPIYTVGTIFTNLNGGQDVTNAVAADLFRYPIDERAPPAERGDIRADYNPPRPA